LDLDLDLATAQEIEKGEECNSEEEEGNEETFATNITEQTDSSNARTKKGNKQITSVTSGKRPTVTPLTTSSTPQRHYRQTGKSAYIVYLDESSVQSALSAAQSTSTTRISWPSSSHSRGLSRYTSLHDTLRLPLPTIRLHADSSLALYDYDLAQSKALLKSQYKKGEEIVDEDGFTLVVRGGAYGQSVGGGVGVASKQFEKSGGKEEGGKSRGRRGTKKKAPKEKDKFYAFQLHEKKREDLIKLKTDWESDKAKVNKLRQERKFKPY